MTEFPWRPRSLRRALTGRVRRACGRLRGAAPLSWLRAALGSIPRAAGAVLRLPLRAVRASLRAVRGFFRASLRAFSQAFRTAGAASGAGAGHVVKATRAGVVKTGQGTKAAGAATAVGATTAAKGAVVATKAATASATRSARVTARAASALWAAFLARASGPARAAAAVCAAVAARVARAAAAVWAVVAARVGRLLAPLRTPTDDGSGTRLVQTRQQRLVLYSRRLEVAAAVTAVALGLCAALLVPEREEPVRQARASSDIAEGVSRPGAVDAPGRAPDSTEGLGDLPPGAQEPLSGPVAPPMERSRPTRVSIPQVEIDVDVFGADLAPDGGPPTPSEANAMRAAWYAGGVSPGESGAAILVGHLDTYTGPAAFAGLGSLRPGATINIDRADGTAAIFVVDSVELYPKADFPNERVYGTVDTPQLRLITCGGQWTPSGGYDANIVVYARLAGQLDPAG